jgi:hypothetical protein
MLDKKQIYPALLSTLFLVFLLLPLLFFVFGSHKTVSDVEKRKLAVFPKVTATAKGLSAFPKQFDSYYRDHFGLRDRLIRLHNSVYLQLFRLSPSNFVLQGRNGWFFYAAEGVVEDYYGQQLLDPVSLDRSAAVLQDRRDWLATLGVRYLFAPVPNKITVYDEYLPFRVRHNRGTALYEQFLGYLAEKTDFSEVVDFYSLFRENKQGQQLYFKTDTHWSNEGALLGFNEIIKHCSSWFPGRVQPVEQDELYRKTVQFSGDLSLLMNLRSLVSEDVDTIHIKEPCAGTVNHPPAALAELTTPLGNDPKQFPVENGCADQDLTVLVIHDSFGRFLQKYFNERFKKVIYSPYIKLNGLRELIALEQPDIVIELWVARNLGRALAPDPLLTAEMLARRYGDSDQVRLQIGSDFDLTGLNYLHDVQLENRENGLLIQATGNDPFFVLPFVPPPERAHYLVEVELDAPGDTLFALYFTTAENPEHIQPAQVVEQKIKQGYNRLLLRLSHPAVTGLLRIDPGTQAGSYLLRSLTVRAVSIEGEKVEKVKKKHKLYKKISLCSPELILGAP